MSDASGMDETVLLEEKRPALDRSLTESRAWRDDLLGDLEYLQKNEVSYSFG